MTTYTTLTNAALAVGAIPSASKVQALRDNPIAMAEAASGAPINVMGWHPVSKATVGDGEMGVLYDYSLTGATASVVTPDFTDGYEYRIVASDLSHDDASNRTFNIDLYLETSASYEPVITTGAVSSGTVIFMDTEIVMPRLSTRYHMLKFTAFQNSTILTDRAGILFNSTAQKILRARMRWSIGNIDNGKIWLMRRREFLSAD